MVRVFREHAPVMGELFRMAGADPVLREQGSASTGPVAQAFADSVVDVIPGAADRASLVADVMFRTVFAACTYRVSYGANSESSRELSWDLLEEELARMCTAYATAGD
jgi:hypothetical protein